MSPPNARAPLAGAAPVEDLDRPPAPLAQLERVEALFEALPLAIAVFDDTLLLVRANSRFHELTGHALEHSYGRSVCDAFPNARADFTAQVDAARRGERPAPVTAAFDLAGGARLVEVEFTALGEELGDGGVLCSARDVTDREQLREELTRSAAAFESSFDVIPDSVRVYDAEGRLVRANRQALLDHDAARPATLAEVWALDAPRALDGTPLPAPDRPTARALRGETVRGVELLVRRGPGGAPAVIEVSSNPMRDAQGRIIGAVTVDRDVTERARLALELADQVKRTAALYDHVSTEAERLERMVEARTQELLELQEARARERRLAAIGQLAAGVMHDVNNALNPIMAAAYLLEVHADDPRAVRDYAARIARAAETGAATAARVGRFIRQEPADPTPGEERVDLSVLADEVVAMTRPLWAERARGGCVHLEFTCDGGVDVRGTGGEIREAMLNLVQNALDAMPGGGTLGIATRVAGGEGVLEVRDTGAGMSGEVRERAFEPFFTTKGLRGTGLGLSEVYGIMKRHRGRAEIESAPGHGTVVRLCFPLAAARAPAAAAPAARRAPRRVLLVEDNAEGREFMQALLESDGHTVASVGTARDALVRLERMGDAPPFDVLVTDVGLPDGTGWDLVQLARARWPSMRLGVVTGWEVRSPAGAAVEFTLRKPLRTHEFLALVAGAS